MTVEPLTLSSMRIPLMVRLNDDDHGARLGIFDSCRLRYVPPVDGSLADCVGGDIVTFATPFGGRITVTE
jgi:hypothetical protein